MTGGFRALFWPDSQVFWILKENKTLVKLEEGLPRWCSSKESTCQCRRYKRHGFDPWVGKIPQRRKRQSTPVFLPGKFHGQRSLASCSPWGHKELDMTEWLSTHTQIWRNMSFHVHGSQLTLDVPPPWVFATTHQGTCPCGYPTPVLSAGPWSLRAHTLWWPVLTVNTFWTCLDNWYSIIYFHWATLWETSCCHSLESCWPHTRSLYTELWMISTPLLAEALLVESPEKPGCLAFG